MGTIRMNSQLKLLETKVSSEWLVFGKWLPSGTVAHHPSYQDMIKEAVHGLKGFQSKSRQVISSFIKEKFHVDNKVALAKALKTMVEKHMLVQIKGSYKKAPTSTVDAPKVKKATKKASGKKAASKKMSSTPKKAAKAKAAPKKNSAAALKKTRKSIT